MEIKAQTHQDIRYQKISTALEISGHADSRSYLPKRSYLPNLASAANVDWWGAAKKALSGSVKCCEILVCSHFFLGNLCLLQQPPSNHFQLPVFVWEYKKLSYLIQVKKALIEQTDLHLRKRYVFKYAADWIKMCKNENKKGKKLGKRERRKQELICISKRLKGLQN